MKWNYVLWGVLQDYDDSSPFILGVYEDEATAESIMARVQRKLDRQDWGGLFADIDHVKSFHGSDVFDDPPENPHDYDMSSKTKLAQSGEQAVYNLKFKITAACNLLEEPND